MISSPIHNVKLTNFQSEIRWTQRDVGASDQLFSDTCTHISNKSVRMDHVISYIIYQSTCLTMVIAWSLSINCLLLLQSKIISIHDKESQRRILNWKNCERNKRGLYHTTPSLPWTVWGIIFIISEYTVFQNSRMAVLKWQ
jgi:hypothetical protein